MDRSLSYVENRLVCGIKIANLRIFQAASESRVQGHGHHHRERPGGAATSSTSGTSATRACYRIRGAAIQQMTRDHSLLEDYKEAKPDMTEEEQRNFPHKNVITRALGMRETVQVDIAGPRHPGAATVLAVLRRPVGHGRRCPSSLEIVEERRRSGGAVPS